jgi:REP element-mobilizing transposase RayT
MPQSLSQIYLHIVFSPKNRAPYLSDPIALSRMHGYLLGACRNLGAPSLQIGGIADHVHLLCNYGRELTVSNLVMELKRESSKWIKTIDNSLNDFHWQSGYGAFSVSPSHVKALKDYIADQEEHHSHESFQDEYRRLLIKYNLEYDERYVWD